MSDRREQQRQLAEALLEAYQTKKPIRPLRDQLPDMTLDDAYAIQLIQEQQLTSGGRKIIGRKIGLTSLAMQQMLGVDSPDFGFMLDDSRFIGRDDAHFDSELFLQPRIEPELAFVLKQDLSGPGVTLEQAVEASRGRLDDAVLEPAATVARRSGERMRLSPEHTVVALAGATGSGKSSTFNALTGLELSAVGLRRPTTSWATACVWGSEGAQELLEWLGIPERHQTTRDSMLDTRREGQRPGGVKAQHGAAKAHPDGIQLDRRAQQRFERMMTAHAAFSYCSMPR